MGMEVGESHGSMATPNVVPLIDILLVLIIIFMVITPLTPKGLDTLLFVLSLVWLAILICAIPIEALLFPKPIASDILNKICGPETWDQC